MTLCCGEQAPTASKFREIKPPSLQSRPSLQVQSLHRTRRTTPNSMVPQDHPSTAQPTTVQHSLWLDHLEVRLLRSISQQTPRQQATSGFLLTKAFSTPLTLALPSRPSPVSLKHGLLLSAHLQRYVVKNKIENMRLTWLAERGLSCSLRFCQYRRRGCVPLG